MADDNTDTMSAINDIVYMNDQPDHVEARASLQNEISSLVKPHRSSSGKPPFSSAEMVVMAMICGGQKSYDMYEILHMICKTYRYYDHWILGALFEHAEGIFAYGHVYRDLRKSLGEILPIVSDVLLDCRVPLFNHLNPDDEGEELADFRFSIVPTTAQIFLEQLLFTRKGTFPFFKLPPELRNTIYPMVLQFPRPGFQASGRKLELLRRAGAEDIARGDLSYYPLAFKTGNILSILLVLRQTYREAMPIFYGANDFKFEKIGAFNSMTKRLRSTTIEHLRCITLMVYSCEDLGPLKSVAQQLANVKKFELLSIYAHEDDWFHMSAINRVANFNRKTPFTMVKKFPGFYDLAKAAAKADKFELQGECPQIEAFFDEEIKKIKAAEMEPAEFKKRGRKRKGKNTSNKKPNIGVKS